MNRATPRADYPLRRRDIVARIWRAARISCWSEASVRLVGLHCGGRSRPHLHLWGAMGGAVSIGLGLALAQPEREVMVITGDGELMMGIGSLATVATQPPANLSIVVLDNERFEETGGQLDADSGFCRRREGKASGIARASTVLTRPTSKL